MLQCSDSAGVQAELFPGWLGRVDSDAASSAPRPSKIAVRLLESARKFGVGAPIDRSSGLGCNRVCRSRLFSVLFGEHLIENIKLDASGHPTLKL